MRLELSVLVFALTALAWSPSTADDPDPVTPDEAEVYIEVHGAATVAVDEDEGIVDIQVGDTRIYAAEEAGRVDIEAPGFTLKARRK